MHVQDVEHLEVRYLYHQNEDALVPMKKEKYYSIAFDKNGSVNIKLLYCVPIR